MKPLRVSKPTSAGFAVLLFALFAGSAGDARAQADVVPMMTIKIFNDDPNHWAYPVLTTGKRLPNDIWLQAFFKVPLNDIGTKRYASKKAYRLYINPADAGIPPNGNIVLRLPLFTQLAEKPDPTLSDQYIDWWNGTTIQLYLSDEASPPKALLEALARPSQKVVTGFPDVAVRPRCADCQKPLTIYSDDSDLPKNDPSQLLEFTLGARVDLGKVKNPATDPPNALDLENVDFDVSYVNLAYAPAAMGPFNNDQVGYVGTPQRVNRFRAGLKQFLQDFPGWPQFVHTYSDNTKETLLKLPSPLEVFARLSGKDAPPDLTPPPSWPDKLWPPIADLKTNWVKFAGAKRQAGVCQSTANKKTFCDAIVDIKKLMLANYKKYRSLFPNTCSGTPVPLTDDLMIAHVYGWSPFVEAVEAGKGCGPRDNLLADTPGYEDDFHAEYRRVKLLFDNLNYGSLKGERYAFNPWVLLIHDKNYLNTPNAYAYSVDDAVGNIQANATGIIIDIGSADNLENKLPASAPINVNLGYSLNDPIRFTRYRLCVNDKAHEKPVIPSFPSFIVSANNPQKCPIFLFDNKAPPQLYTFTLTQEPPFKVFENPSQANWKTADKPFNCKGNTEGLPFQPSSATWCCDESASTGLFAFSQPDVDNPHQSLMHNVQTIPAQRETDTRNTACNVSAKTRLSR
jgi:hypothetical protein